jgi:hypothetical protein
VGHGFSRDKKKRLPPRRANRVAPQTPFAHPPPAPKRTAPPQSPNDSRRIPYSGIIYAEDFQPMSKQEEAALILKLYDLRREEVMRKARGWYIRDFNPATMEDFMQAMSGEHSGYLRMVISYWDMASALVNEGAISLQMFEKANAEHIVVFCKSKSCSPRFAPPWPRTSRAASKP